MDQRTIEKELSVAYEAIQNIVVKERIKDNKYRYSTFFGDKTLELQDGAEDPTLPSLFPEIEDRRINKAFRGHISSFGAAIITSGLASSIAFYNEQKKAAVNRKVILYAIDKILNARVTVFDQTKGYGDYTSTADTPELRLFSFARDKSFAKEEVVNATIALKLALQLFPFDKPNGSGNSESES